MTSPPREKKVYIKITLANTVLATRDLMVIFIQYCGAESESTIEFVPIRQNYAGLPGPSFALKIIIKRLGNWHFYVFGSKICLI